MALHLCPLQKDKPDLYQDLDEPGPSPGLKTGPRPGPGTKKRLSNK